MEDPSQRTSRPLRIKSITHLVDGKPAKYWDKIVYRMLHPLTRPAHIHPSRRVKWRLRKKWFGRYEKQTWIGRALCLENKDGSTVCCEVVDVRIKKDGGHTAEYSFTLRAQSLQDLSQITKNFDKLR